MKTVYIILCGFILGCLISPFLAVIGIIFGTKYFMNNPEVSLRIGAFIGTIFAIIFLLSGCSTSQCPDGLKYISTSYQENGIATEYYEPSNSHGPLGCEAERVWK